MSREADISGRLESLLTVPVAGLGYQLLEAQYRREGHWVVRLLIDRERGVGLDDCRAVSELAGRILEVEDLIPNEFSLEVSSPGIFRSLSEPKHFQQSLGKIVRISLDKEYLLERKNRIIRGKLNKTGKEGIVVETEEGIMEVPFTGIRSAKLDPDIWKD